MGMFSPCFCIHDVSLTHLSIKRCSAINMEVTIILEHRRITGKKWPHMKQAITSQISIQFFCIWDTSLEGPHLMHYHNLVLLQSESSENALHPEFSNYWYCYKSNIPDMKHPRPFSAIKQHICWVAGKDSADLLSWNSSTQCCQPRNDCNEKQLIYPAENY